MKIKKWIRPTLFTLGGALAGLAYYHFIGCASGSCPITSSPFGSMLYPVCMVGTSVLLHSADHYHRERNEGILQPLLRTRSAVFPSWWSVRAFQKEGYASLDEKQGI
jgi:hypothetical protein